MRPWGWNHTPFYLCTINCISLLLQHQYSRVPIWVANRVSSTARDGRALAPPLELALSPHKRLGEPSTRRKKSSQVVKKLVESLIILVSCEIWYERNVRIFRHVISMPAMIVAEIKKEARTWVTTRVSKLQEITLGKVPWQFCGFLRLVP